VPMTAPPDHEASTVPNTAYAVHGLDSFGKTGVESRFK
jgi:hypothetical protein